MAPVGAARLGDRNVRPGPIVIGLTEGDDHVEAVNRAALEHDDQKLSAFCAFRGDTTDEARREAERHERHRALTQKNSSGTAFRSGSVLVSGGAFVSGKQCF
jgi:hypothetical protein